MFQTSVEVLQILQKKTYNCSNKLHEKPCKADFQQLQDWTKPDLHTFKWHQIAANVLQIASNAFIKSAKSIAQLLQFSIKYAANMLQMWLTSNSFKSEIKQALQSFTCNCVTNASKNHRLLQICFNNVTFASKKYNCTRHSSNLPH